MASTQTLSPRQVGQRIRQRRMELHLSMPELGRRIGVNKSTIQRYESDGVNPGRSLVIHGLAEALHTTPQWLTGQQDPPAGTPDLNGALHRCLDILSTQVPDGDRRRMLADFLAELLTVYGVVCGHYARAVDRADSIGRDDGLRRSLDRYAIDADTLTEETYRQEMQPPLDTMKAMLDCLLDAYREDPRLPPAVTALRQEARRRLAAELTQPSAPSPSLSANQRSPHNATL